MARKGIQNGGAMFLMSPHRHRCCQHNAGHAWPYWAQHLYYATPDDGLAAVMYAPCVVTARVGDGAEVRIRQETGYPFEEDVTLTVSTDAPTTFPLHLRIPGWCKDAEITVNGRAIEAAIVPGRLTRLEREWSDGDEVRLRLPMSTKVRRWPANHDFASVHRGPLTFSLDIGERRRRVEDAGAQNKDLTDEEVARLNERWPAVEILPEGDWNYALVEDPEVRVASARDVPEGASPWTPETAPIVLETNARRLPEWQLDMYGLAAPLQDSPAYTEEPVEWVRLIPMGAARIRISAFPVASNGPDANRWTEPRRQKRMFEASASHTYETDMVEAIADNVEPASSNDHGVARHTFWPHRGTLEWLQASFDEERDVSAVSVYWFDDRASGGQCRVPASWRVLYREGTRWIPVATSDEFGTARDQFNTVTFEGVRTDALRLEIQLQEGYSAGVLEWAVD